MLRLLTYLLKKGIVTNKVIPHRLEEGLLGLPKVTKTMCDPECDACIEVCPTNAIGRSGESVTVDRGACIACGQCIALCPTGTIENDLSVSTFAYNREDLIVSLGQHIKAQPGKEKGTFNKSLAIRVVSTGCSACDLEISAANNPIFDMERFGVTVVASPRFADALVVTGPVPKAMHESLKSCYDAMAHPKIVIACGTCAISGGVHKGSYTAANGIQSLVPVDVFIPGCPPHPWQLLCGILAAQQVKARAAGSRLTELTEAARTSIE